VRRRVSPAFPAWLTVCTALLAACTPAPEIRVIGGFAQGTTYSLQWVGGGTVDDVDEAAAEELERIDALLSNYRPDSTLERFNVQRTTEPVELPRELVALLELAKRVHAASAGCFDPTVRPLVRAWGFDGDDPAVPPAEALDAARAIVGLDRLELIDATHVRKTVPELEIDMASIGQGYAAGRLAAVLERLGSTAYLAEIGGEIVARGVKPDGSQWRVGVENPAGGPGPVLRLPAEPATAVVTSGSYRRYFEADGRRYGHIIDPRSGQPVEHALLAATVVGPDAATAAAWGTALLCMGPDAAAAALERENVAAVYWLGTDGGAPELVMSPAFAGDWRESLDAPPR
jgi:thiamine biosynthesis lipoprotein